MKIAILIFLSFLFSCTHKQRSLKLKKGDSVYIQYISEPQLYIVTYNDSSHEVIFYKKSNMWDDKDTVTGILSYVDIATYSVH